MLYELMKYLSENTDWPGMGLYQYISFRAAMAVLTSLFIALIFGKKIINYLRTKQYGELVRDLGLDGQKEKEGTPTMGGIIIILATVVPVLLWANLSNVYILLLLFATIWMGAIGFLDDYLKKYRKNKDGLSGIFKVIGQVTLGLVVALVMIFNENVVIKHRIPNEIVYDENGKSLPKYGESVKDLSTTIPFVKHNEFNYGDVFKWIGLSDQQAKSMAWLFFIPVVIFIITAVSNGANLTDGIDGLAAGTSTIIVATLALFAWISGNLIFADYLNLLFIPNTGEVVILTAALVGALIGFLWYNTYPAQVFMGDTGSLTIGGVIAVLAIILRKEMLLPILCGIFLAENLSVVLQVSYFKYTKRKTGQGKRIFLMSPLHHHFQKMGYHESKIVNRFLIVGFALAIITIITLKIR